MKMLLGGRLRVVLAGLVASLAAVAAPASAATSSPPIKHVFVIVLENKGFNETFGFQSGSPYLSQTLPSLGALVPSYYGVTHQSLGNYIAMISGPGSNLLGTQLDCQLYVDVLPGIVTAGGQAIGQGCVYPSPVKTVADQLASAGLTWKGYMEDMGNAKGQPPNCRHPAIGSRDPTQVARAGDQYAARHNPFVYFHSLLDSGACARYDVPLDRLGADLASAATTPSLSFITPNLCNDGHDARCAGSSLPGGLPGIDRFLRNWVPQITGSPAYRSGGLLAIVFDEADGSDSSACCNEPAFPNTISNGLLPPGPGGGRTGAVLLSPFIDPGTLDTTAYNHFTLLRSVEDLFGLGHLGYAGDAGLHSLGADAFTCYAQNPRARLGRLPSGSLIKLAVIGQGTAARPMVEVKLWHAGRVSISVTRRGSRRASSVASRRGVAACELLTKSLPYAHGTITITARAFGGAERRTLSF
jgi:hypothetical protein